MSLVPRSTQHGVPSGHGVSRVTILVTSVSLAARSVAGRTQGDGNTLAHGAPGEPHTCSQFTDYRRFPLRCYRFFSRRYRHVRSLDTPRRKGFDGATMSEVAMYSKTRLGSDQMEGALSLTPRGKRVVYLIVAVVVAAGVAIGVWTSVSHDDYATSANGCVSLTVASSTGAGSLHYCGAQARAVCRAAAVRPGRAEQGQGRGRLTGAGAR